MHGAFVGDFSAMAELGCPDLCVLCSPDLGLFLSLSRTNRTLYMGSCSAEVLMRAPQLAWRERRSDDERSWKEEEEEEEEEEGIMCS
jgi:hypothetical protein